IACLGFEPPFARRGDLGHAGKIRCDVGRLLTANLRAVEPRHDAPRLAHRAQDLHRVQSAARKIGPERAFAQAAMAVLAGGQVAVPIHLSVRSIARESRGVAATTLTGGRGLSGLSGRTKSCALSKRKQQKRGEQSFHGSSLPGSALVRNSQESVYIICISGGRRHLFTES